MPNSTEQNLANHTKLDPRFHFFILPVFALTFGFMVMRAIRAPNWWNLWGAVVALAAVLGVFLIRVYALKVQDRVIRLEERLRLGSLAAGLSESQLIALRFASDDEAGELARKAAAEKLGSKQIKSAIRVWRPDHFRI